MQWHHCWTYEHTSKAPTHQTDNKDRLLRPDSSTVVGPQSNSAHTALTTAGNQQARMCCGENHNASLDAWMKSVTANEKVTEKYLFFLKETWTFLFKEALNLNLSTFTDAEQPDVVSCCVTTCYRSQLIVLQWTENTSNNRKEAKLKIKSSQSWVGSFSLVS